MLWIDTPMVQDAKSDLPSFRKMLDALPGPLGKTTSVEACGEGIRQGHRAAEALRLLSRICVGVLRWLKPLLATRFGEATTLKSAPKLLPQMDAEVEALGRSVSARTESVEKR